MKKMNVLGILGAAAAGIMGASVATSANQPVQQQQQQSTKKQPIAEQKRERIRVGILPAMIGGVGVMGKIGGFGIPPREYGMYHVKRGTHKYSNKRK